MYPWALRIFSVNNPPDNQHFSFYSSNSSVLIWQISKVLQITSSLSPFKTSINSSLSLEEDGSKKRGKIVAIFSLSFSLQSCHSRYYLIFILLMDRRKLHNRKMQVSAYNYFTIETVTAFLIATVQSHVKVVKRLQRSLNVVQFGIIPLI